MDEQQRRHYLQAMGIPLWERRDLPQPVVESVPEEQMESAPVVEEIPQVVESQPPPAQSQSEPRPQPSPATALDDGMEEPPSWLMDAPPIMDETLPPGESGEMPAFEAAGSDLVTLDWDALEQRVLSCKACELHKTRTQAVFGVGNRQADLLVIGEAPGAEEDRQGEPFVGRAGKLLDAMLKAIGFDREQVFIANILKCRPPGNRDPKAEEALHCMPYLMRQIALVQPRAILAVGRIAAQNLLNSEEAVGRLRGRVHYLTEANIPLIVSYHPAYLLRSPEQKGKAWQDLQRINALLKAG